MITHIFTFIVNFQPAIPIRKESSFQELLQLKKKLCENLIISTNCAYKKEELKNHYLN